MNIGIISELTDDKGFSRNAWQSMLERLNIPYRKIIEDSFEVYSVKQGRKKKIIDDISCLKYLQRAEIIDNLQIYTAEIPFRLEELNDLSDKLLKKYMYKAICTLNEKGIGRIVFTNGIKQIYKTDGLSREMLGREFSSAVICNIGTLVKKLGEKCGVNPLKTQMGIVCKVYEQGVYELLKKLVLEVGGMRIYTEDIKRFSGICIRLYEDYGVIADVCEYRMSDAISDFIVCDYDSGIIKFGRDVTVTDLCFGLKIRGYNLKDIEFLDLIGENSEEFYIKYCISGKNRLTI